MSSQMQNARNTIARGPSDATDRREASSPGLPAVRELLGRLHEEDILYCHWKSNEHLEAALLGITDLDILVDRRQSPRIQRLLGETGFKRFAAVPCRSYPAIEDYLALDASAGGLIHVHLHHELVAGEKNLKGYRLPWEHLLLSTRCFQPREGVYVAAPEVELILLLVRAALKIRTRDRITSWSGGRQISGDLLREFDWLQQRIQPGRALEVSRRLLGGACADVLNEILSDRPTFSRLRRLRESARPRLRHWRTFGVVEARARRWFRELSIVRGRLFSSSGPKRRTLPSGGISVALLGSDGSGKSTLVREIVDWLSPKVDVRPTYCGSGPAMKRALGILNRLRALRKAAPGRGPEEARDTMATAPPRGRLARCVRLLGALLLAHEKRATLRRAWRARNRGVVVVCDRYPQCQVMGFNDGPLLDEWLEHRSRLLRALARWERAPYRWADAHPPDLVVKLHVTPRIACQRKPEIRLAESRRKTEGIKALNYREPARIVDIDADAPLEQVLLQVKQCIWNAL